MTTPPESGPEIDVPNHHAHYPGFDGASGLLAALSMSCGRDADAALAIELTGLSAADHLVDIGCGPGTAARRAARLGARVTGVDPAPVMLRVARVLDRAGRVTFVEGGAEALPLPDRSATVVWSIASVHHWPDLHSALAEVRRVLAPGGRFLAVERHTEPGATGLGSHGWTDAQAAAFADMSRATGFTNMRIEPRTAGRRSLIAVLGTRP